MNEKPKLIFWKSQVFAMLPLLSLYFPWRRLFHWFSLLFDEGIDFLRNAFPNYRVFPLQEQK